MSFACTQKDQRYPELKQHIISIYAKHKTCNLSLLQSRCPDLVARYKRDSLKNQIKNTLKSHLSAFDRAKESNPAPAEDPRSINMTKGRNSKCLSDKEYHDKCFTTIFLSFYSSTKNLLGLLLKSSLL